MGQPPGQPPMGQPPMGQPMGMVGGGGDGGGGKLFGCIGGCGAALALVAALGMMFCAYHVFLDPGGAISKSEATLGLLLCLLGFVVFGAVAGAGFFMKQKKSPS